MSKEIEAALIIGSLALALGALLLVPAIWLARRGRANPESFTGSKVSKAFIAGTAIAVLAMLGGLSAPIWTPDSELGQWLSNDQGRFTFMGIMLAVLLAASVLGLAVLKLLIMLTRALEKPK